MEVILSAAHTWPTGPYSAVRLGEHLNAQEPVESTGPGEPVDEMVPISEGSAARRGGSLSTGQMAGMANQAAGAALAGFPQVVHVLANPELHLGQQIADETGLPVVSLDKTPVDDLEDLLSQPQYEEGFILEGFPSDLAQAREIDSLLEATDPAGRRVLGWESNSPQQQSIVDHYIDQGLLWVVGTPASQAPAQDVKSSLVECLVGLPALK